MTNGDLLFMMQFVGLNNIDSIQSVAQNTDYIKL
jgi:hypothetical protein